MHNKEILDLIPTDILIDNIYSYLNITDINSFTITSVKNSDLFKKYLSNITQLDLENRSHNQLTSFIKFIINAEDKLTKITDLNLSNNILGFIYTYTYEFVGLKLILEYMPNLKHINLSNTSIGISSMGLIGIKILIDQLKLQRKLISIDISNNDLEMEGLSEISEIFNHLSNLNKLNFKNTSIGTIDIITKKLKYLPNLTELNISSNFILRYETIQNILNSLIDIPELKILDISDNEFIRCNESAQFFANSILQMKELKSLDISNIGINDNTINIIVLSLEKMDKLTNLNIQNENITLVGKNSILNMKNIETNFI